MTLQTFAVTLAGIILGPKLGAISSLIYVLMGAVGLGAKYTKEKTILFWTFLILGTLINYIAGTAMFCISTNSTVPVGIAACVLPFIPTTIIKAILCGILGIRLRSALASIG